MLLHYTHSDKNMTNLSDKLQRMVIMEKSLPHRNSNASPGDIISTASSIALSSIPSFPLTDDKQ